MKKRLLPLALSLVTVLSLLPAHAQAAEVAVTVAIPRQFDAVRDFSEGLAAVRDKIDGEVMWGYIDMTGELVIPYQFLDVQSFSEGLAVVYGGEKYEWNWGFIDKTGELVIPYEYDFAYDFSEGLALVEQDNLWGFIDAQGNEVVPCKYTWASEFSEGLAAVRDEEGRSGYIDKTGREVIPLGKYKGSKDFSEGLAVVWDKIDGEVIWGFIDKTGELVIPYQYETAYNFSEGLAAVELNGAWGYIDKTGQVVIPCRYESADSFSEGRAAVRMDGAWGYIDMTGELITPYKYESVRPFSGGVAIAWLKDVGQGSPFRKALVSKDGEEVFYLTEEYGDTGAVSEGLLAVDGKQFDGWGFLAISVTVEPEETEEPDGEPIPASGTAYASTQSVLVDGAPVEFQCYALKDANGNDTNYIKLRDVASILNGTAVQFEVGWDGAVNIETGKSYTPNGSEMKTPFSGDRAYETATAPTNINGTAAALEAIVLKDDAGGAFTYYKLRDLGTALGFKVDWSAEKGIFIETK